MPPGLQRARCTSRRGRCATRICAARPTPTTVPRVRSTGGYPGAATTAISCAAPPGWSRWRPLSPSFAKRNDWARRHRQPTPPPLICIRPLTRPGRGQPASVMPAHAGLPRQPTLRGLQARTSLPEWGSLSQRLDLRSLRVPGRVSSLGRAEEPGRRRLVHGRDQVHETTARVNAKDLAPHVSPTSRLAPGSCRWSLGVERDGTGWNALLVVATGWSRNTDYERREIMQS